MIGGRYCKKTGRAQLSGIRLAATGFLIHLSSTLGPIASSFKALGYGYRNHLSHIDLIGILDLGVGSQQIQQVDMEILCDL
jgi:hypothetical protein